MSKLRTLVMVPTYNELENVNFVIESIFFLGADLDLLFVDDNSPDGTGQLLDQLALTHPRLKVLHRPGKQGIGSAHKAGIRWAYENGYERLVTMDSDLSHSPRDVLRLLSKGEEGADVVVGSRFLAPNGLKDWAWIRKLLTHLGHFLTTYTLKLPQDCTNAFRLYRIDRIPFGVFEMVKSPGYSFMFESLHCLNINGFSISQISIELPARTYGHSKMKLADIIYSVKTLGKLWWRTAFDRASLVYAVPYQGADLGDKAQDEWDSYWREASYSGKWLYDLVAHFYRRFIIRPAVNYFLGIAFADGSKILHAGCGSGTVDIDASVRLRITGFDISGRALTEYGRRHARNAPLMHGSLFSIPCEADVFDGAFNLGVMEHFTEEDIVKILRELSRVVKPGGRIVLFWPPVYGLATRVLKLIHLVLKHLKKDVQLHPPEITHVKSRNQINGYLRSGGFALEGYYFGVRDFFTHQIIVATNVK
jgi:dolichol-phosphate mannosyltransferase